MLLALIPIAFFLGVLLASSYANSTVTRCWRQCVLFSVLSCALLVFISTEFLSFFTLLNKGFIAGFWILVCACLCLGIYARRKQIFQAIHGISAPPLEKTEKLMLAAIICIGAITLFLGIFAPPNSWDSMTYHLPRVMHWEQNMSVAFYPTHITRQLHRVPFMEYAILHIQLLAGSDRFFNTIQWVAMAGSLVAASLLTEYFGARRKIQFASALVVAALPNGIMQASMTYNDYTATFFVLCFVWLLYGLKRETPIVRYLATGIALGLAIITKSNAILACAPFGLWFVVSRLRSSDMALRMVLGLGLAFAMYAPHLARNLNVFNAPFAPHAQAEDYSVDRNEKLGIRTLLSNLMRETTSEIVLPSIRFCNWMTYTVRDAHSLIGANPDDKRTTLAASPIFWVRYFQLSEYRSSNPLHFLLLALVLLWPGFWRGRRPELVHTLLALSGFLLFCFFVKWSPWGARLHMCALILTVPAICSRLSGTGTLRFILPALTLASSFWLFFNTSKPFFGPMSIFTRSRLSLYPKTQQHEKIAREANEMGCCSIGLITGSDGLEYPLWRMICPNGKLKLKHIQVNNQSAAIKEEQVEPCYTAELR